MTVPSKCRRSPSEETSFPSAVAPHWRKDDLLGDIDIDSFDLLSIDVFDTLLMRKCRRPDDVFLLAGHRLLDEGLLREGMTAEAFRMARIAAEAEARSKRNLLQGDIEITLEDIYEVMRGLVLDASKALAMEICVEGELVIVNPVVHTLLEDAQQAGKIIILVSDMYLGAERIRDLLAMAGVAADRYNELLVSSDLKLAKYDGSVFRMLLERSGAPRPERILHVGDHPLADGAMPSALGIRTAPYSAIAHPEARMFAHEQIYAQELMSEYSSLRRVLWHQVYGLDDPRRFWRRFGCCVLGPFLDAFANWVVETCTRSGIRKVIALMRDGHTIAPLIQRANLAMDAGLDVTTGWLSRRSVFFGAEPDPTAQSLSAWFEIDSLTIHELFEMLDGVAVPEDLQPWSGCRLSECAHQHREDGADIRSALTTHLLKPSVREKLQSFLRQQRSLLVDYVLALADGDSRIAFVDIGFAGTIGRAVHEALRGLGRELEIVNLLGIGHVSLGRHLLAGMDVRCYSGGFGRDWDLIQRLFRSPAFLEEMIIGDHGSACGYVRGPDGRVSELRCLPNGSAEELSCKTWCQEGIANWQAARTLVDDHRGKTLASVFVQTSPADMLRLLLRSVVLPTAEEARFIGDISHDYGLGGGICEKLCPSSAEDALAELGPERFLDRMAFSYEHSRVPWPEGTLARRDPYFLVSRALRHGEAGAGNAFLALSQQIFEEKPGRCLVYGASGMGQQLMRTLRLLGVPVAGFVDRNPALWSMSLEGFRVHSPEAVREMPFDAVAIGSVLHAASMVRDIREGVLGHRPGLKVYPPFCRAQ